MSLRARLLLAVGAVALVALVAANVVTYTELSSFLYNRVDQDLQQSTPHYEQLAPDSDEPGPGPGPQPEQDHEPGGPSPNGVVLFVEVVTPSGQTVEVLTQGYDYGEKQFTPALPSHITGFSEEPDETEAAYFTTSSKQAGGPSFRVRAEKLDSGDILIVAEPVDDVVATLRRLEFVELIVSACALVVAAVLGWWLVRRGLQAPRGHGAHGGVHLGGRARRTRSRRQREDRDRQARPDAQRDAHADTAGVRRQGRDGSRATRLRGTSPPFRCGRVPRAAHAARRRVGLRRAIRAGGVRTARGSRPGPSRHQGRDGADGTLGRRPPAARSARRRHTGCHRSGGARLDNRRRDQGRRSCRPTMAGEARSPTHPVEMPGDAPRLRQVVDNLLANVRAHTPPGTTTTVTVATDDGAALIEVADNGPGLTEEQAAKVFERFYRTDTSRRALVGAPGSAYPSLRR